MSLKVLHSSDWHLGQNFMHQSRASEHEAFLQWLIQTIQREEVDVLIVAGDIFDTGSPPSYARKMYYDFLVELHKTCCQQVIILAGNHDSVAVLQESQNLLSQLGVYVIAGVSRHSITDPLIPLLDKQQQLAAIMMAVPFLRPSDISSSLPGQNADEKRARLIHAIKDYYQQLYKRAQTLREATNVPIISTGHLSVIGSKATESVRDIYIGQLDALPLSALPDVDYCALGHIHKPQCVGGLQHIRYSGSPLALSFDESSTQKQVTLISWDENGTKDIQSIDIPCFRVLKSIKGTFNEIKNEIPQVLHTWSQAKTPDSLSLWLEIILQDTHCSSHQQSQLIQLLEGEDAQLLRITKAKAAYEKPLFQQQCALKDLQPEEVFKQRMTQQNISDPQLQASMISAFKILLEDTENPIPLQDSLKESSSA